MDSRHFENFFHIGCIYARVEEKKDLSEINLENYFLGRLVFRLYINTIKQPNRLSGLLSAFNYLSLEYLSELMPVRIYTQTDSPPSHRP